MWIDLEMTGLEPARHVIVEIACIVTDAELRPLDDGVSYVVSATEDELGHMDDFVTQMHTDSGLLPEIPGGISMADAEQLVLEYIKQHVPEPKKVPLAGSSIYVDRGFLAAQMPQLNDHLHYRLVDVSSIKELCRRWYPKVYFAAPQKMGNHRALADIADSIRELSFYRAAIFVPESPDLAAARDISNGLNGS